MRRWKVLVRSEEREVRGTRGLKRSESEEYRVTRMVAAVAEAERRWDRAV